MTTPGRSPASSRFPLRWLLAGLAIAALLLLARQVPVDWLVVTLTARVRELGAWGIVLFGAVYVLAAVLLLPASAFTIAAGALFGLVKGTVIVSVSATIGAAVGFLLGRHAARERVARRAARSRTFAAIDRAIAIGGWKVVALLRLSPAMPFSIGNYLFGLTAVRFWPYVAATAVAMLPGIFMYIYLGYLGGQLATGATTAASRGRWALLGLGLVATVAATVYITRLARRALHEQQIDR